ncbi:ComEC/Rec2 family competence protein [Roseburia hominis]
MKKRYVCQVLTGLVIFICILYAVLGEKAFPALARSRCETLLAEGETSEIRGRIFKKDWNGKETLLYLDRLRIGEEEVEKERVTAYVETEEVPKIGQYVQLCGKVSFFEEASNPGNFDQKFYQQKQRTYAAFYEARIRQTSGDANVLREHLWSLKRYAQTVILQYLGEEKGRVLCSMLLGSKMTSGEEEEAPFGEIVIERIQEKELYQKSGIGHILAISGLHVSFLGMGLYRLLRRFGSPVPPAAVVGSIVMCFYVIMTGASVSAVRAVLMFLLRMGAYVTGREYDGVTALSVAALAALLTNPLSLLDTGFQLSYGAILGIYGLGSMLGTEDGVEEIGNDPAGKLPKGKAVWLKIKKSLRMPLAVQIVLLPILLFYYYEVCPYSLVWNLVAIPLASVIFACGIGGVLLGSAAGFLAGRASGAFLEIAGKGLHSGAALVFKIVALGMEFYYKGAEWILSLPGARWVTGRPGALQIAGYIGFMLAAVLLFRRTRRQQKNVKRRRGQNSFQKNGRRLSLLAGGLMLCGVVVLTVSRTDCRNLEIVMLNVDQGDSFFIRGPEGGTYLIDGGSSGVDQVGKYRIEPFLKSQGVGSVDYVWISHGDIDHLSGIMEMLSRKLVGVRIRNLILPPGEVWDEKLTELAKLAGEAGTRVCVAGPGQSLAEGELTISCLWPKGEFSGNEASMVLSLTYGEFDMLFTGDLEKEGEAAFIAELKALKEAGEMPDSYELLKVGHHGSKFATSGELLETVRPDAAWISAGKKNRYGHPHPDVLERLANWSVTLYNTKDGNAVKLCTDGKKYCILRP